MLETSGAGSVIRTVMRSSAKNLWLKFGVAAVGAFLVILFVLLHTPAHPWEGASSFEFVNGSDLVVSNLDLELCLVLPRGGEKASEYSHYFRRHFTNVSPGASVVVQSNTPMLMLCSVAALHRDCGPTGELAAVWMGMGDFSGYNSPVIVARPGRKAGLRFVAYNEFKPMDAR